MGFICHIRWWYNDITYQLDTGSWVCQWGMTSGHQTWFDSWGAIRWGHGTRDPMVKHDPPWTCGTLWYCMLLMLSNHGCAFHKVLINQSKICVGHIWGHGGRHGLDIGTPGAGGGPGGEEPAAPRSAATGGRDLPGDRRLRTGGAVGEGGLQLDELGFMVGLW